MNNHIFPGTFTRVIIKHTGEIIQMTKEQCEKEREQFLKEREQYLKEREQYAKERKIIDLQRQVEILKEIEADNIFIKFKDVLEWYINDKIYIRDCENTSKENIWNNEQKTVEQYEKIKNLANTDII